MLTSSLSKAISGLSAAQKGLQVTGHNISNTNTTGYTRQQLLQSDSSYLTVGTNGGVKLKTGLGVDCDQIRQVRDQMVDKRLRTETSVLGYYQKLNTTALDVESSFDEPYGSTVSDLINNFWSQTQKLSTTPDGVEERMSFISTAKVLIGKINAVSDSLTTYQSQLNTELTSSVNRINEILEEIKVCNDKISQEKVTGENANDFRDERNLLLDELSKYGDISYYEEADRRVVVKFEGHTVVNKNIVAKMELGDASKDSTFKVPVWSDTGSAVFNLEERSSYAVGNDTGSLKAILVARGNKVVGVDTTWDDVALNNNMSVDVQGNAYMIPKVQMQLNQLTEKLVSLVNENFTGTGIGEYEGKSGVPVFVASEVPDSLKEIKNKIIMGEEVSAEEREQYSKYLISGNIEVNPELLKDGGYNKLGTVGGEAADTGDNSLIKNFLAEFGESHSWNEDSGLASSPYEKTSTLMDFFSELVTDLGSQSSLYASKASEKNISVTNIENERQAMSGVSTDEEFSNMLKYQYAYNASSRMITMLDGMLETIINQI